MFRIPLGFKNGDEFLRAVGTLREAAGASDALIGVRGSAATGLSRSRGVVGTDIGDIDFFIVSQELYDRAIALGARAANGALRVSATQRYFPRLAAAEKQLSEWLGIKTTVRIFSPEGFPKFANGFEVWEP